MHHHHRTTAASYIYNQLANLVVSSTSSEQNRPFQVKNCARKTQKSSSSRGRGALPRTQLGLCPRPLFAHASLWRFHPRSHPEQSKYGLQQYGVRGHGVTAIADTHPMAPIRYVSSILPYAAMCYVFPEPWYRGIEANRGLIEASSRLASRLSIEAGKSYRG